MRFAYQRIYWLVIVKNTLWSRKIANTFIHCCHHTFVSVVLSLLLKNCSKYKLWEVSDAGTHVDN